MVSGLLRDLCAGGCGRSTWAAHGAAARRQRELDIYAERFCHRRGEGTQLPQQPFGEHRVSCGVPAAMRQEPLTEAKRADIMRLVQTTGSGQIGLQFVDVIVQAVTENMKAMRPD